MERNLDERKQKLKKVRENQLESYEYLLEIITGENGYDEETARNMALNASFSNIKERELKERGYDIDLLKQQDFEVLVEVFEENGYEEDLADDMAQSIAFSKQF